MPTPNPSEGLKFDEKTTTVTSPNVLVTTYPSGSDWESGNDNKLFWTLFHCIIAVIGMIGNAIVFIVILRLKHRGHNSNINVFIMNQSIIDFLTSAVLFAINVVDYLGGTERMPSGALGTILCGVWYSRFVLFSLFVASTFNIMMMALERYIAVVKPHYYNISFNKKKTFARIIIVWLMAPVMQIYPVITQFEIQDGACVWVPPPSINAGVITGVLIFLYEFFIPLISMSFMYTVIVLTLRESARKLQVNIEPPADQQSSTRNRSVETSTSFLNTTGSSKTISPSQGHAQERANPVNKNTLSVPPAIQGTMVKPFLLDARQGECSQSSPIGSTNTSQAQRSSVNTPDNGRNERRAPKINQNVTVTILMVVLMFAILWTPNQVTFLVINFGVYVSFDGIGYHLTVVLAFCNQCINPVLYAMKYKPFQSELKKIFCKSN